MIIKDVMEFLKKVPPFQVLAKPTMKTMAGKVSMEFYPKGIAILTQAGLPSNYLQVIQKGGVKVFVKSGNNLSYTTPVGDIATKKLVTESPNIMIQDAAKLMAEHKISSLSLADEKGSSVGIITDRDLGEKVVARGISVTRPAREVMSTLLVSFEALLKLIHYDIHHLSVVDEGNLKGIVTNHDLMMLQGTSPVTIAEEIESRDNIECLIPISDEAASVIAMLLKEGAKASNTARTITELNERLVNRIIEIELRDNGPPLLPYCWVVFGGEGRKEQTFKTDQDNAPIYAGPKTKEEEAASRYFTELTKRVNDALIKCGFPPCPTGYMASNPKWRQPLRTWKRYFTEWITTFTPDATLLFVTFFDFRPACGDTSHADALRNHLIQMLSKEKFFLAHMGAMVDNRPPLGFSRTFVVEENGEHKDLLYLKVSAIALLVDIIRLFSLEGDIRETSTLERIHALKDRHGIIGEFAHELEQSFEFKWIRQRMGDDYSVHPRPYEIARHFDIPVKGAHNAVSDAFITAQVLQAPAYAPRSRSKEHRRAS